MPQNTLSDREVRRIAKVVLAYERRVDVPRVRRDPPQSDSAPRSILIHTPPGGIPAATGSGPYTWGTATCKRITAAGAVTSTDVVVTNIVNQAIAGSVAGKADPVDGIYVIDVASCGV